MSERSTPSEQTAARIVSGALADDLTKAVEIVSATHEIPGSSAYVAISRAARRSRLSVRQTAQMIVRAGQGSFVSTEDLAFSDRATA